MLSIETLTSAVNNGSLDSGQDFVSLVDQMGASVGDVPGGIVYGAGGPGLIDSGNEVNHVAQEQVGLMSALLHAQSPAQQDAVYNHLSTFEGDLDVTGMVAAMSPM